MAVLDESIIERYTDQQVRMPQDLRERIEAEWGGASIQLYALADLDASLKLSETWVALGPDELTLAYQRNGQPGPLTRINRAHIRGVREIPGLSCTQLVFQGEPGEPALGLVRYTHRQRRAMENIRFILEQQIEGRSVEVEEADTLYAESVAHAMKTAQASVVSGRMTVIWRLLRYMLPYKGMAALGMLGAVMLTLLSLVPPWLTGYAIDNLFRPVQAGVMDRSDAVRPAVLVITLIAVVYLTRQFFVWVRFRTMTFMGEYIARDLRNEAYGHLQKLSLNYFSSKQTGSIIARISSDTDRLWEFLAFGAMDCVTQVGMLISLGVVLLLTDWRLGLLMLVPMPLVFFALHWFGRRIHRVFLQCWRKWSGLTAILADTIPGAQVVKAFNQEEREEARFGKQNSRVTSEFLTVHRYFTSFYCLLWLFLHLMLVIVWVLLVPRVLGFGITGPDISVGVFVSSLLYMGMYFQPIDVLSRMPMVVNRATSSAHRVFDLLDTQPEITLAPDPVRLEPLQGHVVLENVSFAYDGVRQVLQDISFEVQPGEMIGLVGPSGAGKSTVINLIARFYDVSVGRILVDGVDLRDLDVGHYRRQLGMVLQDPYLFHGTLLENIRYGVPEATLDQVIDAAQAANAHDFICTMPQAYDTVVGERGHTLSGGERQRVSIARAILCDPRILILDEATSSVDTETEYKIQEALQRLVKGRTVFAIAHRLSTLRKASRLFVIEDGRITEQGTHAELLANPDGMYTKLVNMQLELHEMHTA